MIRPLDKSWVIRCLCLDIIHGYTDGESILKGHSPLSNDIQHALTASKNWKFTNEIFVGESATLFRFLQFIAWKKKIAMTFVESGSLLKRDICEDYSIVDYSFKGLLLLDDETSQWASAAYLCGKRNNLPAEIPYKFQVTIDACNHWERQRAAGLSWEVRYDQTIANQARYFEYSMLGTPFPWEPQQSEDYCFARAFGLITKEEGMKRWPTLVNHETNRIEEMERAIVQYDFNGVINSVDHRVTQALVMWSIFNKKPYSCWLPKSVNKSWPEFWTYLEAIKNDSRFSEFSNIYTLTYES